MIPKLTKIPKHREFESSYDGYVCPYCGVVYSVLTYVKMELDGNMKCTSCGRDWIKEGEEWLRTVTPFDVLCPRCGWGFKEVWLEAPNWSGEMSKIRLCRRCAEEVHEKWPGSEVKEE